MDYINTELKLDDVKKIMEELSDTPEKYRMLRDLQVGHDTMVASCNLIIEKNKAAIFRLFRRKMIAQDGVTSNAYKLGLMCALGEMGLHFSVKNEQLLKNKMTSMEKREKRYNAMQKAMREQQ